MREAIYDVMRFWLRKGVDGFRVDVIWHLIKDADFATTRPIRFSRGPAAAREDSDAYSTDQPEVHDVIAEMRRVIDEFDDRVLIGEIYLPLHGWSPITARISPARSCRSTSRCCRRRGARARSRRSSPTTRRRCRRARGRTGCSAITTARGSPAGSGATRRASRRCCC